MGDVQWDLLAVISMLNQYDLGDLDPLKRLHRFRYAER